MRRLAIALALTTLVASSSVAVATPAGSTGTFTDIHSGSKFANERSWLANSGITTGYADGSFKPHAPITRDAMAAFMYRFQRSVGTGNNLVPANPGDVKNCSDFKTWREAKTWHNRYFPYYGDIARLDGNNDGLACTGLAGAPTR